MKKGLYCICGIRMLLTLLLACSMEVSAGSGIPQDGHAGEIYYQIYQVVNEEQDINLCTASKTLYVEIYIIYTKDARPPLTYNHSMSYGGNVYEGVLDLWQVSRQEGQLCAYYKGILILKE